MNSAANDKKQSASFSEEERAAMKQRASELKEEAKSGGKAGKAAAAERDVLDKIASMPDSDRAMAERVHMIVMTTAPELAPKLWYGQPGYARNGKMICFFRSGLMDKARYSTFGFAEDANLDDASGLWPTSYALSELTDAGESQLRKQVKKAVG